MGTIASQFPIPNTWPHHRLLGPRWHGLAAPAVGEGLGGGYVTYPAALAFTR